jgi:hypothetical protein
MKNIIRTISYYYDYYVGTFIHAKDDPNYHIKVIYKYPERFKNEIQYLEELKKESKKQ